MCVSLTKKKIVFMAVISTKNIRTTEVGKSLVCEREPLNSSNRYGVAVLKDNAVVGHLPRQLSWMLSLFILRNDTTDCLFTGGRIYSTNPTFSNKYKKVNKLSVFLSLKATSVTNKLCLFL